MVFAITTNENFSHKIDSKYHMLALFTVIIWGTTFISTKILINNGLTPTDIFYIDFCWLMYVLFFFLLRLFLQKIIKMNYYYSYFWDYSAAYFILLQKIQH